MLVEDFCFFLFKILALLYVPISIDLKQYSEAIPRLFNLLPDVCTDIYVKLLIIN